MKVYAFLLVLAVFTASAAAGGYGCDVPRLIGGHKGGIIDKQDLKYIIQSQHNQYLIVTAFFNQGNVSGRGKLTLAEFSKAYSSFIYFILGRQISADFLYARWKLADFTFGTDTIDLSEFTFLITLDLKFIYRNYDLFCGDLKRLSYSVDKLERLFAGKNLADVYATTFFGFDFNKNSYLTPKEFRKGFKLLGYVIGVDLKYTDTLLNDLFYIADYNNDFGVSYKEGYKFIGDHLAAIKGFLDSVANAH